MQGENSTRGIPGRSTAWRGALALGLLVAGLSPSTGTLELSEAKGKRVRCAGLVATVVGTPGDDVLRAPRRGPSVIHGLGGNDRIVGSKRPEVICGGPGRDRIYGRGGRDRLYGGAGEDYVDGGRGADRIWGGGGADVLLGGEASDVVRGGPGADRLYGGLQDDWLNGGSGDDLVVGGHGADKMKGGPGDDYMRGGTQKDWIRGDSGNDTASWADATPSGFGPPGPTSGVTHWFNDRKPHLAVVIGDDAQDEIVSIENVLGSAFDDRIGGNSTIGPTKNGKIRGLAGTDHCERFTEIDCPPDERPRPLAFVDDEPRDPGVIVLGDETANGFTVSPASGGGVRVESQGPLNAGEGCAPEGATLVCRATSPLLGYVLVWGGDGDDTLTVRGRFAPTTTVRLDGGRGSDRLTGGPGEEVLDAGDTGEDTLLGGAGDDSLVARAGPDRLFGGPGSDQLATSEACDGHLFDGGPGRGDIAGFAITRDSKVAQILGVRARIGGLARTIYDGKPPCTPTRITSTIEVLEGTSGDDVLIGSPRRDALLGHAGDDILRGLGGNDYLRGGPGADRLFGGRGADLLDARDGERDRVIDCGPGGRRALIDRKDPKPRRC